MAGLLAARRKNGPGRGRKSVLTPKKRATAMKLLAAGDRPRDVARPSAFRSRPFTGIFRLVTASRALETRYLRIVPFGGHGRRLTTLEVLSGRLQAT